MKLRKGHRAALLILSLLIIIPGLLALLMMPIIILVGDLRWSWASLRSFDRWVNVVVSKGNEFDTISGHAYQAKGTFIGWFLVNFLELFEKNHCERSNHNEEKIKIFVKENVTMKGSN